MFSLIFKTIEDDASASSIRITSIFSTLHDNIKLILSKAATESSFSFEDGFEESLNNDLAAINNYITAVRGGMSETEALASSFMDASAAAKDYANSTKFAEVNTEDYTTKAKLSQVSTLAQNKSLSDTKKLIDEYGTGLKKCGLSQEQYLLEIKKTNPQLAAYLANLHGADATLKGYIGSLFSAKAATIALQIATTALNAVIGMGIGLLLSLIASGLSALFDSIKEALRDPKEVIEELDEELSSLQSTIQSTARDFSDLKKNSDEIIPRFAELAKGVDEFGNRLTDANDKMILTDEEYEEFWELNNKIAEMFPDLDVGIDSNGNHILSLSYSVNTLTESLEALVEAERQAANQKIIENLDDTLENIEKAEKAYKKETTMITGKSDHLTSAYNTVKSYGDTGFSWNTSDRSDRNADRYKAKAYKDALDALGIKYTVSQSGYNTTTRMYDIENIIPDDADWDRILREYKDDLNGFSKEFEDTNAKAAARWKKLNPIMGAWLQTTDSYDAVEDNVKNLLSKVIGNINYGDIGITDADDLKKYLQDNVIDTLINAAPDVQDAVKRLFLNDGELSINEFKSLANKIKEQFGEDNPVYLYVKTNLDNTGEMANTVKSFIKDEFDSSVDELSLDDLAIAASDDFWKFLNVPDGTLLSLDELNKKLKEYKELSDGVNDKVLDLKSAFDTLGEVESGIKTLATAINELNNDGAVSFSSLKSINDAFGSVEGIESYISALSKAKKGSKEAADIFNDLAYAYIKSKVETNELTEENEKLIASMLEEAGVENSLAVAQEMVSDAQSGVIYSTKISKEEYDKLDSSIKKLLPSIKKSGDAYIIESRALEALGKSSEAVLKAIALSQAGMTDVTFDNVEQRLKALQKEAEAYQTFATTLASYSTVLSSISPAASKTAGEFANLLLKSADPKSKEAYEQYQKFLEIYSEFENLKDSSPSIDWEEVESKSKKAEKEAETWFERQYKDHQHMVNMEQETDAQYLAWLETAYQKAYDEGIITLDEYYKYQEEVYKGYKSLGDGAENWFEKQQKEHQHLVNMQQESDEQYLKWLDGAYKSAYSQGLISLDDYRKYQEEVFTGMQSAFKDYLNDIEHEISMAEGTEKDNKKVLNLYKKLISAVEKEIRAARAKGLSDTDDYIQDLQSKLLSYQKSIEDLEDNVKSTVKSSVDNLVDIRVKMLKQDVQNEKDAIDKKIKYLQDFYNKQKEMLQDQYDEEKYLAEQNEKRNAVSKLQSEIEKLRFDDSAWAQKRRLELAQELADAQRELDEFEKEKALERTQDELDKQLEMQKSNLDEQSEMLESKLNDAGTLYRKALSDIKTGSIQLYQEMIQWNSVYGDGISDTIKSAWEDAYKALQEYKSLYGTLYEGVDLQNVTGYVDTSISTSASTGTGLYKGGKSTLTHQYRRDTSGSSVTTTPAPSVSYASTSNPTTSSSASSSTSNSVGGTLTYSEKRKVAAAIWDGTMGWGADPERANRLKEVFGANNGIQALVDTGVGKNDARPSSDYTYLNMRKKYKGYASGTKNATAGLHAIDELGTETIFESADGARYKMFTGGEKVLNAKASNFLYDFATKGNEILSKFIKAIFNSEALSRPSPALTTNEINMGDIIIQGGANEKTVSEIRREQRSSVEYMLKQLGRLQK